MKIFKTLYAPIARGNEYREQQHGPRETLEENTRRSREMYRAYRETQVPRCRSMFEKGKQLQDVDSFKSQFQYWDEWSGSQFVRRENPRQTDRTQPGTVCQSNPVTGFWEALQ
jgi:hypothetical protein